MKNNDWQGTLDFIEQAFKDNHQLNLFKLLLTPDEREVYVTRVKIVKALLEGEINQRQLKEQLGIGIATVTRGSNSLKEIDPQFKQWLEKTLLDNNN